MAARGVPPAAVGRMLSPVSIVEAAGAPPRRTNMRIRTMKLTSITLALGALSLGTFALAAFTGGAGESVAFADNDAPMRSASEVVHATATVSSIDRKNRTVMLKKEDGDIVPVQVPPEMTGFDRLKVGDKVDVDYYEAVAVSLLPPGTKPSASERVSTSHGGGKGGAIREQTVSAEVIAVDPAANTVTFKGPKGNVRTIKVQDPEMQARLKTIKPGQVVQLTYSEAVAATIRPKSSSGKME